MSLACFAMGMTLEEALVGATLNAAWSIDRSDTRRQPRTRQADGRGGRQGRPTNLVRVGAPSILTVIKRGKVIFRAQ